MTLDEIIEKVRKEMVYYEKQADHWENGDYIKDAYLRDLYGKSALTLKWVLTLLETYKTLSEG